MYFNLKNGFPPNIQRVPTWRALDLARDVVNQCLHTFGRVRHRGEILSSGKKLRNINSHQFFNASKEMPEMSAPITNLYIYLYSVLV